MTASKSEYFFVELGPIPDMPTWHIQSKPNRYPFPTAEAARRFAANHQLPGREVKLLW